MSCPGLSRAWPRLACPDARKTWMAGPSPASDEFGTSPASGRRWRASCEQRHRPGMSGRGTGCRRFTFGPALVAFVSRSGAAVAAARLHAPRLGRSLPGVPRDGVRRREPQARCRATLVVELLAVGLVALLRACGGGGPRTSVGPSDGTLSNRIGTTTRNVSSRAGLKLSGAGKRLRLLEQQEGHPAELGVDGDDTRPRKHPAGAVHGRFESHGADFAGEVPLPGQVALVVLEVRADLVSPLGDGRKIAPRPVARDRRLGADGHQRRCGNANAELGGDCSISDLERKPTRGM